MKIAIDIRKIGKKSTGDESVTYHLVTELAKLPKSKKHNFLLLTDEEISKVKKLLPSLPKNFKIYKVAPTTKLFWTFYSLPRFLKKYPVDIFHTHYIVPFYLPHKIKIVTIIHDVSFRANPKWINRMDSFLLNTLIPLSLKRADAVMTVSEFSKKEIIKHFNYPAENISVTHLAPDIRYCSPVNEAGAKIKLVKLVGVAPYRITQGVAPFILYVGSLQPRKNIPLLIKAFKAIREELAAENSKWQDIKLVIAGNKNGHNYDNKINKLMDDKNVIMPGYISDEDKPYFFNAAKLAVFPSEYEGFGIPLVEAMASGTPVLASNIGSFKEVGGNAATYFNLNQPEDKIVIEMAKKMKKLLKDEGLRKEKIALGVERAKMFKWEEMARKVMRLYEKVGDIRETGNRRIEE